LSRSPISTEPISASRKGGPAPSASNTLLAGGLADLGSIRIEDILSLAPAGIGVLSGPEHRWTYVNEKYIQMTGRNSAADFVGKTLAESLPEVEPVFLDLLDEAFRSGKPYTGREAKATLVRTSDRQPQEAYFDFVYQPIRGSQGRTEGILVHAVEVTDRVHARKALEDSSHRLRLAQNAAQIGTWEWDPVENTRFLSLELHEIFDTNPNDPHYEETWAARIYSDDRSKVEEYMLSAARSGAIEFEYRYQHPRLGLRWFFCKGSKLPGRTTLMGFIQDVTARKLAEAAMRESEERFRSIVEATPECVKLVASDGTLLHMNTVGVGMVGAQRLDMVVGKNVYDLIAREDRDRFRQFNERICNGERGSLEFDIVGIQGVRRHMETHAVPLRNADGSLVQLAVTRDITERERAREAARRLSAIVSSSDDAIVSKDLNGIVTTWNSAAQQIFGYTAEEMIGRPILTLIPPELHDDEARILQTIARGERIDHFETVRLTKSGERIDVSITVSPVKDESGRIVGAAKIARDITQRKKSERALHTAERLAAVGRLAATVAHEINNPLEALTNLIYLARNSGDPAEIEKYLAGAEEELERVSQLTKQTLGFYRETKSTSAFRLGSMVNSTLLVFSSRMRNKSIEVHTEIKDDPPIRAVPGEIRQLIANLVSNSIDALDGGGLLRTRVSSSRNSAGRRGVRFTVADTGVGIPAEARPQLFEPFFTSKKEVGTGLGLWVCKSIVEKHGGTIRLRSSAKPQNNWTVFSIFLPVDAQHDTDSKPA